MFAATGSGVFVIDQSAHPAGSVGDVNSDGTITVDELLLAHQDGWIRLQAASTDGQIFVVRAGGNQGDCDTASSDV